MAGTRRKAGGRPAPDTPTVTVATPPPLRVLHVAAEVFPLIKTGGLADVAAALPPALRAAGADARLLIPGYPAVLTALRDLVPVAECGPAFGAARVRLLAGSMPEGGVPVYVIESPWHWSRAGGPYQDAAGRDWPDNLQRFALLGWVAAQLAAGALDAGWSPEIVHAHDWHAALAVAYLHANPGATAASIFTVHNLAFQGRFDLEDFALLGLPAAYLRTDRLEYHHTLSFMKGALQLADRLTTVSPTYAREIGTVEFGFGLDGVIRTRGAAVRGILNGIDTTVWDPAHDAELAAPFDAASLDGKRAAKRALQASLGLAVDDGAMLTCIVSRLTDQKGLDLVLHALPVLAETGAQLALLGTGTPALEQGFTAAAAAHPDHLAVTIGYDETLAHRLIAGADAILVPSRFEPCGLTQLYGLRYGTLPIVRRVGGLADTVQDAGDAPDVAPGATGWTFDAATPAALADAIHRAAARFRDPQAWSALVAAAMARDHSWNGAAQAYLAVYRDALTARVPLSPT